MRYKSQRKIGRAVQAVPASRVYGQSPAGSGNVRRASPAVPEPAGTAGSRERVTPRVGGELASRARQTRGAGIPAERRIVKPATVEVNPATTEQTMHYTVTKSRRYRGKYILRFNGWPIRLAGLRCYRLLADAEAVAYWLNRD